MTDQVAADIPKKVAIIGAGVTGLLLAQGLTKNGFDVTVYDRDESLEYRANRPVSFMIHWGFETIADLLPAHLWADIRSAFCNPAWADAGEVEGIKFYSGHTGELLFQAPPTVMRRMTRQKLRGLAARDLDIRWGTRATSYRVQEEASGGKGVVIKFEDGSEAAADFVVGADGPRSKIRAQLIGDEERAALTKSDFVCGYTSAVLGRDKAEAIMRAHPMWAMAYHSEGVVAIGAEDCVDPDDVSTWVFNVTRIWRGESDPVAGPEAIRIMKERSTTFAEPFGSIIQGLPDDVPAFVRTLNYWRTVPWESPEGKVTLAGDSAHPMLPFRGQGLNNALDDALKLVNTLVEVKDGKASLKDAIAKYEADLVERGAKAVEIAVGEGKLVQNMDKLKDMVVAKRGVEKI